MSAQGQTHLDGLAHDSLCLSISVDLSIVKAAQVTANDFMCSASCASGVCEGIREKPFVSHKLSNMGTWETE